MLRITRISQSSDRGAITLKLEGKLIGPWCEETRTACHDALRDAAAAGVRLDLHEVSFVDAAGARLLRELLARRDADGAMTVVRCSNFVAELLNVNPSERA